MREHNAANAKGAAKMTGLAALSRVKQMRSSSRCGLSPKNSISSGMTGTRFLEGKQVSDFGWWSVESVRICATGALSAWGARSSWKGEELCGLSRRLVADRRDAYSGGMDLSCEPAEIFRAKIAKLLADGVIGGAALSLFRRRLLLLLLQQEPVKFVIFTHRNQQ